MNLLLYLTLAAPLPYCEVPRLDNHTPTWTTLDNQTYESAVQQCRLRYKNSPCLKVFRKVEERRYQVVCGGRK
jgi:hypothetical protein